jgi:glycine oxidase
MCLSSCGVSNWPPWPTVARIGSRARSRFGQPFSATSIKCVLRNAQRVDVAVIGGGIIGLAVAWRARQRGLSVVVLERGIIGGESASGVAAGMLAPVSEVEFGEAGRHVLELGLRSARMWEAFARELEEAAGIEVGLRQTGTLVLARDDDEARELERQLAFRESLRLCATRLRASAARGLEPALAPTVRLALEAPEDHSVDPRLVLAALRRACELSGVRIREHARVVKVELEGATLDEPVGAAIDGPPRSEGPLLDRLRSNGSAAETRSNGSAAQARSNGSAAQAGPAGTITGVALADGERVRAEQVVLAAGAWSGELPGLPPRARVPVRPVKGQILRLREPAGPGLLHRVLRFEGGYLVPRGDGRYVLGATVEERGFEAQPTAGGVYELLRDARELVPGILELQIEELSVGFRPATPDNAPVIGPSAVEGLVWATGHHRNGVLLAPLTAELVADVLVPSLSPPGGDSPAGGSPGGKSLAGVPPGGESPAGASPGGESLAGVPPGGESSAGVLPGGESSAGVLPGGESPADARRHSSQRLDPEEVHALLSVCDPARFVPSAPSPGHHMQPPTGPPVGVHS